MKRKRKKDEEKGKLQEKRERIDEIMAVISKGRDKSRKTEKCKNKTEKYLNKIEKSAQTKLKYTKRKLIKK